MLDGNMLSMTVVYVSLGVSNGPGPTDRPDPNREVLGMSKDIRVGFRVLFLGYFRVRVGIGSGVGSYKYTSLDPIFSFEKNPTLSASLSSLPPLATSLSSPSMCKSNILLCEQTVNRAEILSGFLNWLSESVQLDLSSLCVCSLIGFWENCGRKNELKIRVFIFFSLLGCC